MKKTIHIDIELYNEIKILAKLTNRNIQSMTELLLEKAIGKRNVSVSDSSNKYTNINITLEKD